MSNPVTAGFTKPSDEIIKLFTPVLAWLDAGATHGLPIEAGKVGFDMSVFIQGAQSGLCGTSCCLAGALQQFNDLAEPACIDRGMPAWQGICAMGMSIGLTQEQCLQLFFAADGTINAHRMSTGGPQDWPNTASMLNEDPDYEYENDELDLDDITPAEAAATLRRFLETGEIKWEVQG